jgi:hypothetical protein
MAMTKEDRKAAAAKAAETRRRNAEIESRAANAMGDPHEIDHTHGSTDHGAAAAHDIPREEEMEWKRPSMLEAPPPRAGFVQRWIRTSIGASADPKNVSQRFREGWRPRSADSVPRGYTPPTILHGKFGEVIGVEGNILCEMPIKMARQREAYYEGKTNQQTKAIEMDVHKVERPNLPITATRKSTVGFEKGPRVPRTQDE